ncbi:hypothetical protein PVA45_04885 [Entomospira entomophila]|uniref:Uncharacterized protein n=1 Tax=Entomospira entomophila TaxID=2719988 RepID=A0A968GA52_9SPIO|nr:hypothetical protein [Entomospira entomophilus]NIZ40836.1 hypothetical protein [Entomospira entomophilus]WDI35048.1 hypothetical protein PVA45_04885 [Entomospira entomophilus]
MKRLLIFFSFLMLHASYAAETLTYQQVLYQGSRIINSSDVKKPAWVRLASPSLMAVSSPSLISDAPQKWRLRIFYSVPENTGSFSIQAKLNLSTEDRPVFSMGWDSGTNRLGSREARSNWLELEDSSQFTNLDVDIYLARATNNPEATIEIHSVQLEIWQDNQVVTKNASLAPTRPGSTNIPIANPQEMAKETAMNYLKAAMSGDRNQMNQLLSSRTVNMTRMEVVNKDNISLIPLPAGKTFADYLENYDTQILPYQEVAGLFDDWEKYVVQNWQISNKSYIFIGNSPKLGGDDFLSGKPLILILEEESGKMVVKGILA